MRTPPDANAAAAACDACDSAAAAIARALKGHGVSRLFTLRGGYIMPTHMAAYAEGIRIVDMGGERRRDEK